MDFFYTWELFTKKIGLSASQSEQHSIFKESEKIEVTTYKVIALQM